MLYAAPQCPTAQQEVIDADGIVVLMKQNCANQAIAAELVAHGNGESLGSLFERLLQFRFAVALESGVHLVGALGQLHNARQRLGGDRSEDNLQPQAGNEILKICGLLLKAATLYLLGV